MSGVPTCPRGLLSVSPMHPCSLPWPGPGASSHLPWLSAFLQPFQIPPSEVDLSPTLLKNCPWSPGVLRTKPQFLAVAPRSLNHLITYSLSILYVPAIFSIFRFLELKPLLPPILPQFLLLTHLSLFMSLIPISLWDT